MVRSLWLRACLVFLLLLRGLCLRCRAVDCLFVTNGVRGAAVGKWTEGDDVRHGWMRVGVPAQDAEPDSSLVLFPCAVWDAARRSCASPLWILGLSTGILSSPAPPPSWFPPPPSSFLARARACGVAAVPHPTPAAVLIVYTEGLTRAYYSSTAPPSVVLQLANAFKVGLEYGLFVDAFKLST